MDVSAVRARLTTRSAIIGASAITLVAVVVGGIAVGGALADTADSANTTDGATTSDTSSVETGAADGYQDPAAREVAASTAGETATRVEIPAIGVDSALEQLPLDQRTGELTPPVEWMAAGWYQDGTLPGEIGPAVIAGHVDSVTAPAVFARLGELVPGDEIRVTLSSGDVEVFRMDSGTTAPKDEFPTDLVYGPTPTPQLRLITCDGVFDGSTGHYLDNLIVFASLAA
jgi:LPXTG-site transpeptidase (sortase) family protein